MTRAERRLLIDTGLLGLLLTCVAAALEYGRVLEPLERFFYDYRARHFQYWTPPPTDKLVHLDIDDPSLETIGRFPWSRAVHAELLDELALAGCKAVAYDVIFPEPEPPGFEQIRTAHAATMPATVPTTAPVTMPATAPVTMPAMAPHDLIVGRSVDNDKLFAESLRRYGRAVVPVSLQLMGQSRSTLHNAVVTELYADPELTVEEVTARLKGKKVARLDLGAEVRDAFLSARRDALYDRVEHEVSRGARDFDEVRDRVLPRIGFNIGGTPQLVALRSQYDRYLAVRSLHKFAKLPQDGLPPLLTANGETVTIARLTEHCAESGYVDYIPLSDGVVRIVPLVVQHRGRLVPQMGLSLACAMLDVSFRDAILMPNRIVLPRSDGNDIEIPVRSHQTPRGRFGMFFDIPWFGSRDWLTMYDAPLYERPAQHASLAFVWEARQMTQRLAKNNALADDAVLFLLKELAPDRFEEYRRNVPREEDWDARVPSIEWLLKKMAADGTIEFYKQFDLKDAPEQDRVYITTMLQSHDALVRIFEQNNALKADLAARRGALRDQFNGKAALIGYIAAAAVADQIPTSLHARCPGVVVHGVVFNSIMTGDFWRATSPWVSIVLTVVMGLLTTLIVVSLTPWKALAGATVLAAGYLLYNGLYFFDYRNLIVGVAGPVTAIGAVWAGGTFARYVLESIERARVKRRFENYVDPALVEYVLETDARLDGEKKELSVVFTDLQGFTTLAEALGEKTVAMLNEYMSLMVPVIRKHRGLLNKFLGDGIMYFFGAPRANPNHPYDAVASVLEMQEVMVEFNKTLVERNLPTLITRAGISTGEMIVGDAGAAQGSDYTVLGDVVNLGARLESANKFFGTRILMNERAHTLVKDRILTRPVGKLQVVGKKEGIITYEAMALTAKATDAQKELARLTTEMVTAFIKGDFERCAQLADEIDRGHGASKLTELYRSMCGQNIASAPAEFTGNIVLTAK